MDNLLTRPQIPFEELTACLDSQQCFPGDLKCSKVNYCVPVDRLCDGIEHCLHGDDESDCGIYNKKKNS